MEILITANHCLATYQYLANLKLSNGDLRLALGSSDISSCKTDTRLSREHEGFRYRVKKVEPKECQLLSVISPSIILEEGCLPLREVGLFNSKNILLSRYVLPAAIHKEVTINFLLAVTKEDYL